MTNYNEDDDLGISEDDTENMTPNNWSYVDDTTPAIDQVLNHRLKDGVGKAEDKGVQESRTLTHVSDTIPPDKHDFEFFVSQCLVNTSFCNLGSRTL